MTSAAPLAIRRVDIPQPSHLPSIDHDGLNSTPNGQHYLSSTPGGHRIVYTREELLMLASSPLSQTSTMRVPREISRSPEKGQGDMEEILTSQHYPYQSNGIPGGAHANGAGHRQHSPSRAIRDFSPHSQQFPHQQQQFPVASTSPQGARIRGNSYQSVTPSSKAGFTGFPAISRSPTSPTGAINGITAGKSNGAGQLANKARNSPGDAFNFSRGPISPTTPVSNTSPGTAISSSFRERMAAASAAAAKYDKTNSSTGSGNARSDPSPERASSTGSGSDDAKFSTDGKDHNHNEEQFDMDI